MKLKRSAPQQPQGEYTGKITRQLVDKAEDLFSTDIHEDQLNPVLDELIEHAAELAPSERQQLEQIARLLEQAGHDGDGTPRLSLAGTFEMRPSEDKMSISLTVHAPIAGGTAVRCDDVLAWLKQHNISMGVELNALRRAIDQAARGDEVDDAVVVRGRPAKPGRDAKLEYFGRRTADGPLGKLTDLQLNSGEFWMCQTGDIVMRYLPPKPGEAGHNALGEAIEPPPLQITEPVAGRHIRAEDNTFMAEVNGVVLFEGERVEARKALLLNQDVTHQSEPINFDGEVHVRAAVRSGAHIKATGNVVVEGPVEAAHIESTEGDVVLRSGVAGQGGAIIRAARDINVRFAESACLFAGQDIHLQVGSLHSRLLAHREIYANQGKGHLAGGVVMAGEKIVVKQLGARGGVPTDVTVGLSEEMFRNMAHLDQLVVRATQRRDAATELADQIRRAIGDPTKLQPQELAVYTKLEQLRLVCDVQLRKLNTRRHQLLAEAAHNTGGRIEILASILPNVLVTIGSGEHKQSEERTGPCHIVFDENSGNVEVHRGL